MGCEFHLSVSSQCKGTMYNVQSTLDRVTVQCIEYNVQTDVYNVQSTEYRCQWEGTMYNVQTTMYNVQKTKYNVHPHRAKYK